MAAADLTKIRKRVIEALLASPRASRYGGTVGDRSTYESTQEITDAILAADRQVCEAIISTPGHPYRAAFLTLSVSLANGDAIPAHVGAHGEVRIDPTGTGTFKAGIRKDSREEVQEILDFPARFSTKHCFCVVDSHLYHAGGAAKIYYPNLTDTGACQAHEAFEDLVFYGAVANLPKDGGQDEFFNRHSRLFELGKEYLRAKEKTVPPQHLLEEELERRVA